MGAERMVLRMRALAWVCVVAISLTCLSAPDLEYEARQYEDQVTEIPTTEFRGIYDPLVLKMPEIPKTHKTKSFNVKIPPIKAYHFPLKKKKKLHIRTRGKIPFHHKLSHPLGHHLLAHHHHHVHLH